MQNLVVLNAALHVQPLQTFYSKAVTVIKLIN